jgi:hypothetical protein
MTKAKTEAAAAEARMKEALAGQAAADAELAAMKDAAAESAAGEAAEADLAAKAAAAEAAAPTDAKPPTVLEIQSGNVDQLRAAIGTISNEELMALLVIEKQSADPRKGALEVIEAEMTARIADVLGEGTDEVDETAQLRAQLTEATDALDAALAKLAEAANVPKPPRKREPKIMKLEVDAKADFANASTVVFGTPGGVVIAALPALEFTERDFERRGDEGRILKQKIELPTQIAPVQIASIGLLDASGKVAAVVELLAPIPAGGSRPGGFAARSILFRKP